MTEHAGLSNSSELWLFLSCQSVQNIVCSAIFHISIFLVSILSNLQLLKASTIVLQGTLVLPHTHITLYIFNNDVRVSLCAPRLFHWVPTTSYMLGNSATQSFRWWEEIISHSFYLLFHDFYPTSLTIRPYHWAESFRFPLKIAMYYSSPHPPMHLTHAAPTFTKCLLKFSAVRMASASHMAPVLLKSIVLSLKAMKLCKAWDYCIISEAMCFRKVCDSSNDAQSNLNEKPSVHWISTLSS